MTALDRSSYASVADRYAVGIVARVGNGARSLLRVLWNRREMNRLSELSDHQLADIGLTRGDLVAARRVPFMSDPTLHLDGLARERFRTEDGARRVC